MTTEDITPDHQEQNEQPQHQPETVAQETVPGTVVGGDAGNRPRVELPQEAEKFVPPANPETHD